MKLNLSEKVMTPEEKARAYDEALEVASKYKDTNIMFSSIQDEMFPVLKESSDERIRKELLNYLYDVHDDDEERARWVAYLEKQQKHEQSHIEEVNGEDYGIDSLYHAMHILEKTLGKVDGYQTDDGILDHKAAITAIKKLYKQKSEEWSKEDEENLNYIIRVIERLYDKQEKAYLKESLDRKINWLKFIKDRIQPKQEWSEEDEKLFDLLNTCVCRCITDPYWDYEKRENISRNIPAFLDKLKTLIHQTQWKPSNEQIRELGIVATGKGWFSKEILSELLEQLKRLKG